MKRLATVLVLALLVCSWGVVQAGDYDPVDQGGGPSNILKEEAIASPAAAPEDIVIDFDTYAGGTEIRNQYAAQGVTFNSICAPGATLVTNILDYEPTRSPPNSLAPCGPAPFNGDTLVLVFDPPVFEMSAWVIDDQLPVWVAAYDQDGEIIATDQSDGSGDGFDQISVSHVNPIARVGMYGGYRAPGEPDGWAIDDLNFSTFIYWGNAYSAMFDNPSELQLMRHYRDIILAESTKGSLYTTLLYRSSEEALNVLLDHPELMEQARYLVQANSDAVAAILNGQEGVVEDTQEVAEFLEAYAATAPPQLAHLARHVSGQMLAHKNAEELFFGFRLH